MLGLAATTVILRARSVAPPATRASSITVGPLPAPTPPPARPKEDRVVALVGQALQAAHEGALPEAEGLLKKALELQPTEAEAWNSLGVVLVRQGETASGVDALRQAVRLDSRHAEAHRNLAVALDRQGSSGEAVTHYRAFLLLTREGHPGRDDTRRRLAELSSSRSRE